jgi:cysteine-rich repeat protein
MDSKLLKICLAACLAVSFAGCDDVDEDAPKAGDSCSPTFHAVLGTEYGMACVDNKIIVTQCGDGKVQGAEQCEGTDVGDATCERKLGAGAVGKVMCKGCLLDYSACSLPATTPSGRVAGTCGDGVLNTGEDCDGANLDNQSCASLIVDGKGTLACNGCKFDYSGCYVGEKAPEIDPQPEKTCGNNKLDDDELCDIDAEGKAIIRGNVTCADALQDENATGEIGCTDTCQLDVSLCEKGQVIPENCGNGQLDEDEACDIDAEGNPIYASDVTCASILEIEGAEGNLSCTAECKIDTSACEVEEDLCGNGQLDEGEFCDGDKFVEDAVLIVDCADGFAQTAHPCNADCSAVDAEAACEQIPENCNGEQRDEGEACDGEFLGEMTCADIIPGSEGELSCNAVCKFDTSKCIVTCGNGQLDEGEECDDGNFNDGDGCTALCKLELNSICAADEDCLNGKCDRGVCVTDEMLALEPGTACNPYTFLEFCKEDSIVYCAQAFDEEGRPIIDDNGEYTYVVDILDCGENGGCGIVDMQDFLGSDTTELYAWCNTTFAEQCNKEVDKITYCAVDNEGAFASYILCVENTSGGYTGIDAASVLYSWANCVDTDDAGNTIAGTCNEELTQCENPAILWCDYETKCGEDNLIHRCYDHGKNGIEIDTVDCGEIVADSVCTAVEGVDGCYVPCTTENDVVKSCEVNMHEGEEYPYVSEKTCTKGDDENLYFVEAREYCDHGCNDETFECIKLVEDEGQECSDSFEFRCDDNIRVGCSLAGTVVAAPCEAGLECNIVDGMATCLSACENIGDIVTDCTEILDSDDNPMSAYVSTYVCTPLQKGNFLVEDDDAFETCESHLCNEEMNACVEPEIELVPCETVGEKVHVCTASKDVASVSIFECTEMENGNFLQPVVGTYLCENGCNEDLTDCAEDAEELVPCETVGETVHICSESENGAFVNVFECTETENGNFLQPSLATYPCENGCNEDASGCAEAPADNLVPCENPGDKVSVCTEDNGSATVVVFECTEMQNGKFLQPTQDSYSCNSNQCNEALTDCSEPNPEA